MKRIFVTLALVASIIRVVNAQENVQSSPTTGDMFNGLTRPLTFNRMIPPYALEVTFAKTVHLIFPAAIRYVDLGSIDLLAAKADGAENVLRVKAATQNFRKESNLSVITEDGSYYTFNVKYADVDYVIFRIVDKKVAKRTAIQEQVIAPLRSYNQVTGVAGGKSERTVFALPKFTIPNDKQLVIELIERDGGRSQTLFIENSDLVRAEVIDNLTIKVK